MSDIKDKYESMLNKADPWDEVHFLRKENKKLKEIIKSMMYSKNISPKEIVRDIVDAEIICPDDAIIEMFKD